MATTTATKWEQQFSTWATPPGKTEQTRCENAVGAVKRAIQSSSALNHRNIRVFTQGSYRNRVNVRKDSDVDLAVLCLDVFFSKLPEGTARADFGIVDASYTYVQFKNEVEAALVDYFGRSSVKRGNKSFTVRENSYHVDADVAPFFEHRRYESSGRYLSGVEMRPDRGGRVINWPEQHYENGVAKNSRTGRRYKAMVRILKSLRNRMNDEGHAVTEPIPGFLTECLTWNVPDTAFGHNSYTADVRASLAHLFNNTMSDEQCSEWGEVSELKYLFRSSQKWTRRQAHDFLDAAWDYLELE